MKLLVPSGHARCLLLATRIAVRCVWACRTMLHTQAKLQVHNRPCKMSVTHQKHDCQMPIDMQDQASIPRPMEVETPMEKPVNTVGYGHGSGSLGALTGNALISKPAGSNMQRLGSKMSIPSAIDSSGLVDLACINQRAVKPTPSASGSFAFIVLAIITCTKCCVSQHYKPACLKCPSCGIS